MRAILTFHSIDDSGSVLSFPMAAFERLLRSLTRTAIPIVPLGDLLPPQKRPGVALTFDDGIRSTFTKAFPVLRDYAVPAHLFLTTKAVGGINRWPSQPATAPRFAMLHWAEVEAMHGAGVRIEAHTTSHPDLRTLSDAQLAAELEDADRIIAQRLGRAPRFFAYPYGFHDARVRAIAASRYEACLTTELRLLQRGDHVAALPRLDSYYLQPSWISSHPLGHRSRAYLRVRGILRQLRARP